MKTAFLVALFSSVTCFAFSPLSLEERQALQTLGYRPAAGSELLISPSGDVLDDERMERWRAPFDVRREPLASGERRLFIDRGYRFDAAAGTILSPRSGTPLTRLDVESLRRGQESGAARVGSPPSGAAAARVQTLADASSEDQVAQWDGKARLPATGVFAEKIDVVSDAGRPAAAAPKKRCDDGYTDYVRGAFFRKIISVPSRAVYGIHGKGRLPRVAITRWSTKKGYREMPLFFRQPLDIPAVFMGGEGGGRALDAGLTWDRVHDARGRALFTDSPDGCDGGDPRRRFLVVGDPRNRQLIDGTGAVISATREMLLKIRPDFAFRPFWRTTRQPGEPWHNPPLGPKDAYFYPGESFTMEIRAVGPGRMLLSVSGERAAFQTPFAQTGFNTGGRHGVSFKRNNELDQLMEVSPGVYKGREKQSVLATKTQLLGARWDEVVLLEKGGATPALAGRSCIEVRGVETADSYGKVYRISDLTPSGGETIDILPQQFQPPASRGGRGRRR